MKYELRTKKWFIHDGKLIEGLITKRELLEVDDHDEGQKSIRRYFVRTCWQGTVWVDEDSMYNTIEDLVKANKIPCTFD